MQKNSAAAVPYLMQYQGSKRRLSALILPWLPPCRRLIEPFAGSAAISLAAAAAGKAERFWLNDLNAPLMALWEQALTAPDLLYQHYAALWQEQFAPGTDHLQHYAAVRARFNAAARGAQTADAELPAMFLYLILRCVKGAVRYNASGEFNQAPDKRRHGTAPERLRPRLQQVSELLAGRTELSALDFMQVLAQAEPNDVVYLDPPYQGVSREAHARNSRYAAGVSRAAVEAAAALLLKRGIPFALSYDGSCGERGYGEELSPSLGLTRLNLDAGRSAQAVLLGRSERTQEALYLSPQLLERL